MTAELKITYTEQEAQYENNNLVKIDLSLEAQVYLAFKHKTSNRYRLLDKLIRAYVNSEVDISDKRKYLSEKAKKLLTAILKKILNGEQVVLNHKYISKATRCKSDQNAKILKELSNILDIKYLDVFTNKNGRKILRHYIFEISTSIVEELKDVGLWNLEFCPDFNRALYNNNKNTSNRSNRSIKSNPSENSDSDFPNKSFSIETKNEQVELPNETKPVVEAKHVKLLRPANCRKKATKAQRKARIYQLPPQFDTPKTLAELKPITQEECTILQSKSGREFTLNSQNQILQDMAKRLTRTFNSRWQFICYFSDCLRYEKRDAVQCSGDNFYIKANVTEENILQNQREKYLEETEQIAIRQPCPENQFRAKLANTLEQSIAYHLLFAMQGASEVKNTLVMSLNRQIELTENEQDVVLTQAQAVFNSGGIGENNQAIEKIQFMTGNQRFLSFIKKENNRVSSVYNKVSFCSSSSVSSSVYKDIENKSESAETRGLKLPKSKWGKVCASFISEYGYYLYKHWLAPLQVEEDNKVITLTTNSEMVQDRIMQEYWSLLDKESKACGGRIKIQFGTVTRD